MKFDHHQIRLDDGTLTRDEPNKVVTEWIRQALTCLPALRGRIADLGCLEGAYAVEFARAGYDVLGIEVRDKNIACCQYVKERVDLPNLEFVQDNVWNVAKYGEFDAVWAGGLLYHLNDPVEFLTELRKVTKDTLVLNTHYAEKTNDSTFSVGPIETHEGYEGRWYTEYPSPTKFESREKFALSSWDNTHSFWLLRDELQRALLAAGFKDVFMRFQEESTSGFNRGVFVAK